MIIHKRTYMKHRRMSYIGYTRRHEKTVKENTLKTENIERKKRKRNLFTQFQASKINFILDKIESETREN